MSDILSLGIIFYAFSLILFLSRLVKSEQVNYYWVIAYFWCLCFAWFGFYYSVFPLQSTIQSTNTYSAANLLIQVQNTTTQYPVVAVNTTQFLFLLTITAMWSLFVIIMGIWEWLAVFHAEGTGERARVT